MGDWFLEAGRNPLISKAVRGLSLPVSFPPELRRADGPFTESPLAGMTIRTTGGRCPFIAGVIEELGARNDDGSGELDGLVYDATGIMSPAGLDALFDEVRPVLPRLSTGGRILLLHEPTVDAATPVEAAARSALDGFVRSLAKELGRKGITVNRIEVQPKARKRLAPLLAYLLGNRASFVTGQPFEVTTRAREPADAPLVHPLSGKVALVTGAARGIGAATAIRLGAEGAHVVCLDRDQDLERLRDVAESCGGSVLPVDLMDADASTRIREHLHGSFGGVDIVVHNAGITRDRTLGRMKPEEWDAVMRINLRVILEVTDTLLDRTLASYGRVIVLSSVGGIAGNPGQTNYAATKAALRGWVSAMAAQLGRRGITVNAIAPGFIETRMTAEMPPVPREFGRRLSALGQGGTPLDVAEAITFLSTPGASGITGQTIRVCGGLFVGA
ncbi:MAG: 3-oxoacyl-ACP reductase [Deltaproteobacteria bacterium]|nr:MAG: 3-oxoacyl-ACP reductase [Deltaproteobacteria bacterium]